MQEFVFSPSAQCKEVSIRGKKYRRTLQPLGFKYATVTSMHRCLHLNWPRTSAADQNANLGERSSQGVMALLIQVIISVFNLPFLRSTSKLTISQELGTLVFVN